MAGLNETARNAILDANSAVWPPDTASLHSADPGNGASPTAATEISGGTPAYARKAAAWGAATGGSKTQTPAAVFDIPGGGTTFGWVPTSEALPPVAPERVARPVGVTRGGPRSLWA